jgi:hypothetical protein
VLLPTFYPPIASTSSTSFSISGELTKRFCNILTWVLREPVKGQTKDFGRDSGSSQATMDMYRLNGWFVGLPIVSVNFDAKQNLCSSTESLAN